MPQMLDAEVIAVLDLPRTPSMRKAPFDMLWLSTVHKFY